MKRTISACVIIAMIAWVGCATAADKKIKKEKLQIVFLLGQSNMVGLADIGTAWYLTQPQYVPPRKATELKTQYFDWNFYWSGARYYQGPKKAELAALVQSRRDSRAKWRQRCNGVHGPWKEAEWGSKPKGGRRCCAREVACD